VDDAPEGRPVEDLEHLSVLFVGAKIDDALYDELEAALLMSDAGVDATEFLLTAQAKGQGRQAARRRRRQGRAESAADRTAAAAGKRFELGRHKPLVMMISGVNGAGKTTTIGKLAKHMQSHGQSCCWPPATPSAPPRASS
jgi:fused signal recognition particle receptor